MKNRASLALLLLCCFLLPALAQTKPTTPAQPQKPSDDTDEVVKITTNLVQVDAVVTKDGKPVTNLTADDFEIYEDGKRQAITSFAFISNVRNSVAASGGPEKRNAADIPPTSPLQPNAPHRTMAFVVDDLGMSAESVAQVRKQLRKFITNELQPNDLVAIIRTSGHVGALQQFTTDRRILTRAVDQLRWNPCSRLGISLFQPGKIQNADIGEYACSYNSMGGTLAALRFIVESMGELPGRKSMIIMSDSMPIESQELNISERFRSRDTGPENREIRDPDFGTASYSAFLHKIAEKAIRGSVVIYSVDTQGLAFTGISAADTFQGPSHALNDQITRLISSRSFLNSRRREGGELIARQTGGFQVRNSNYFELDRIVEDQSGYYLIGYRPTDETFNRRFHHIKAKVKRSGMTLRTRYGFFGVTEEEATKTRTTRDLTNLALASPFKAQDIDVELTSFFAYDKTLGSVVRSFVYLDAEDMTFTTVDGVRRVSLELHGVIFGDNGRVVQQLARGANIGLSEQSYEYAKRYGMGLTFDMPVKGAGAYQVRIAARDRSTTRIGSAGQFVGVPDLGNKKLAVSGIVLGTGAGSSMPEGSVPQAMVNPGLRRFNPNANLYFSYMLYNAANESGALRNLSMHVRIYRDEKVVYAGAEMPIQAGNQTDLSRLSVSGAIRLPAELEAGNYHLQVVITENGTKKKTVPVIQWVEFEIEK